MLEYDGTKYRGWQEQKNARGVMNELREAAEDFFGEAVELQGSGRTDAGVHALAQVAHLRMARPIRYPAETVRRALNDRLPADITVLSAEPAADRFHARHDAISRTYVYQISTRKSAFAKKYVWWVKQDLNVEAMQTAARLLAGRHDFTCFRAPDPGRPEESTIVVVTSAEILVPGDQTAAPVSLAPGRGGDGLILFRIEASHFLWKMVRRLVGTLVQVGMGTLTLDDFESLLEGHPIPGLPIAEWTAPASGLFLEKVLYPEAEAVRQVAPERRPVSLQLKPQRPVLRRPVPGPRPRRMPTR